MLAGEFGEATSVPFVVPTAEACGTVSVDGAQESVLGRQSLDASQSGCMRLPRRTGCEEASPVASVPARCPVGCRALQIPC